MRAREFLLNGGWANAKTQDTVITPPVIAKVVEILKGKFEPELNAFLAKNMLPEIKIGRPCGSGTYYERDLVQQPDKQYGDIDIHFYIPRMPDMNNNQVSTLFAKNVMDFCAQSSSFETENGKNVIVQFGNDYIQVDLVTIYYDNKDWADALAPEWNVKGVLCASLYSALAEALHLSISPHGVQAKTLDGQLVKFGTIKGTSLHTVSTDKKNWAVDIAKFFNAKYIDDRLKTYPGLIGGEVRVADIINSIQGIAETLDYNKKLPADYSNASDLLANIKSIYLDKIGKVINSSKFDKAASPAAVEKAEHTKQMLSTKSQEFAKLII